MANPFEVATRVQQGSGYRASFEGASHSRLYFDWAVGAYHPDRETQWALRELRSRARDLVKNNPYATGIVEAFADNVIGWDEGIRLKPTVTDLTTGELRTDVNTRISHAWTDWGMPETASVDTVDSWLELQRLIVKTWVADGEIFIRHRRGYDNAYAYAIQLIDADLLDENYNVPPNDKGVEIRQGVEINADGRPLAYWFWPRHPQGPQGHHGMHRERLSADDVIHFFVRYRPGQTRGFSLFAPILTTMKMVDGLEEAELVASRLAAAKMGFITNNTPEAIDAYAERLRIAVDDAGEGEEVTPHVVDIEPGLTEELQPGQGFETFDPTHPNSAFGEFLKVMLRGVARGFSMSYLTMTGDVAEANFSSMRAGLLPERDHWRILQTVLSVKVHRRIYLNWSSVSILTPMLQLGTSSSADIRSHEWRPRGWKWVDPLKDLLALELGVSMGVDTRTRGAAQQGLDFERNVDQLAAEEAYAATKGVEINGIKRSAEAIRAAIEGSDDDEAGKKIAIEAVNRIAELNGGRIK